MGRRESYSGDLARVAQRASFAPELASMKSTWRAPRPASWPPPLPADRIPVPPPGRALAVAPAPSIPPPPYARPASYPPPAASGVMPVARAPQAPALGFAPPASRSFVAPAPRAVPASRARLDDNPFARRRSSGRRWATLLFFMALVGGAVAVFELRPDLIPPAVRRPVAVWVADPVRQWVGDARAFVAARVTPTPQGQGLAPVVPSTPAPPSAQTVASTLMPSVVAAPQAITAASSPAPASGKSDPPVVDVSTLPVAHGDTVPAARALPRVTSAAPPPRAVAPSPAPPPRAVAASPAPRPTPAPRPAALAEEAPSPKAAPPPVNTAPAPAPGSLDDLIRKAVEAESKKKH
jgi:hypothetical protein